MELHFLMILSPSKMITINLFSLPDALIWVAVSAQQKMENWFVHAMVPVLTWQERI